VPSTLSPLLVAAMRVACPHRTPRHTWCIEAPRELAILPSRIACCESCGALQAWVGAPAIYVFDCSAAGLILNSFRAFAEQRAHVRHPYDELGANGPEAQVPDGCQHAGTQ